MGDLERLRSIWLLCNGADAAFRCGARVLEDVARAHRADATLFAAIEGAGESLARTALGMQLRQMLTEDKEQQLQTLARALEPQLGAGRVRTRLVDAPSAWHALATHASEEVPDLVIVPAVTEGRTTFGLTAQHLFRKCASPVWALTPGLAEPPGRVLVAVDPGTDHDDNRRLSEVILRFALRFCAPLGARIHLVHAWRVWGQMLASPRISRAVVAEYLETERRDAATRLAALMRETAAGGSIVDHHVIKGEPDIVVPSLAKALGADLVILGSAARTGLRGFFMGSVAERILEQLDCPAIVVKHPSFVSPVAARRAETSEIAGTGSQFS